MYHNIRCQQEDWQVNLLFPGVWQIIIVWLDRVRTTYVFNVYPICLCKEHDEE